MASLVVMELLQRYRVAILHCQLMVVVVDMYKTVTQLETMVLAEAGPVAEGKTVSIHHPVGVQVESRLFRVRLMGTV